MSETRERGHGRLRRVLLAWGLCALAAVVGVVAGARPAFAFDIPKPISNPFATTTSTGTKATGLCRTNVYGCVILAGVGAYEGTCWVLGEMYDDPGGCAEGASTIMSFVSDLWTADRSTYSGPAGVINPLNYTGAATDFDVSLFSNTNGMEVYIEYADTRGPKPSYGCVAKSSVTPTAQTVRVDADSGQATKTALEAVYGSASLQNFGSGCADTTSYVTQIYLRLCCSPYTVEATWTADPQYGSPYTLTYERRCVGGAAGAGQTITRTETFTPVKGVESPGVEMPPCYEAYPGSREEYINVLGDRAGITAPTPQVKVQIGGTPQDKKDAYPLCTTNAPETGCWLDLQREGKSCFAGGVYCAGWTQNITRWSMTCEWGPYLLDMAVCQDKYATKFDGQVQPKPAPDTGGGVPGEGTNPTAPRTDPGATTDPDSPGCFGDAWSWNPVDWIYVPVKCALLWAFKPETSLATRVGTVRDSYSDAPPFTWFADLGAIPTAVPGGDCPDWRVKVAGLDQNVVCNSSYTDAIRSARPVFAAMMIAAAFAPFLRSLAYSAVPILSPVPH